MLAAASGGQLSGRNELGYRVAVSAGVGLGAVERESSDVRHGADQAVHRRGAAAGQRQSWRVPLYSGAGRLWGGGCRLQSDAHAQALRAGLAEGAFAGGVRAGHGILRQYHGHSQGCAVQLRHVADALRNGARSVSGRRVLFRQPGFSAADDACGLCAAQDPQQRTAHLDSRWDRADLPGGQKPSKGRRRRGLHGGCAADAAGRGI